MIACGRCFIGVSDGLRVVALTGGGSGRSCGCWSGRHQPGHTHQVVRRRYEVARQLGARESTIASPTEAAHGFQPAEYLLNPFSQNLTDGVPRMTRGAAVDRAASSTRVLCHVRRNAVLADGRNTRSCVVGLVSTKGAWMKAAQF